MQEFIAIHHSQAPVISTTLLENLGKCFDKGWSEEILPDLEAQFKNKREKVWQNDRPTLTIKHAAVLLNTRMCKFKKFLISYGFVSRMGEASDHMIAMGWVDQTYRNFPNRPQTSVIKITREGFCQLGAMYVMSQRTLH